MPRRKRLVAIHLVLFTAAASDITSFQETDSPVAEDDVSIDGLALVLDNADLQKPVDVRRLVSSKGGGPPKIRHHPARKTPRPKASKVFRFNVLSPVDIY